MCDETLGYSSQLVRGYYMKDLILCECGNFVENHTFKDYIESSYGPSTPTIGHSCCGLIFNFVDEGLPKRFSSKKELKQIALRFAEKKGLDEGSSGEFLLDVDRLKSQSNLNDMEIIIAAFKKFLSKD